mmetsp:Transcript_102973/g.297767  ORF Transcript_102973/g.297767 Transcript_102973/m.297767 type:complete len:233 (+) Transcript_102973:1043-1741(+)
MGPKTPRQPPLPLPGVWSPPASPPPRAPSGSRASDPALLHGAPSPRRLGRRPSYYTSRPTCGTRWWTPMGLAWRPRRWLHDSTNGVVDHGRSAVSPAMQRRHHATLQHVAGPRRRRPKGCSTTRLHAPLPTRHRCLPGRRPAPAPPRGRQPPQPLPPPCHSWPRPRAGLRASSAEACPFRRGGPSAALLPALAAARQPPRQHRRRHRPRPPHRRPRPSPGASAALAARPRQA